MTVQPIKKFTGQNVSATIETINPTTAGAWLELNKENRPVRDRHVAALAKDMAEGRWQLNGEAIVFDWNGLLLDGQHRLWAAFDHQQTFTSLVVRGVDPTAFKTIDSGLKRSAGDVLGKAGIAYGPLVAATIRLVHTIEQSSDKLSAVYQRITNAETAELVATYPGVVEAAQVVGANKKLRSLCSPAAMAGLVYYATEDSPDAMKEFTEALATGAGMPKGDPRLTARNYFINLRMRKITLKHLDQLALLLKAWNTWRVGARMSVLKYVDTEEFPVPVHRQRKKRK